MNQHKQHMTQFAVELFTTEDIITILQCSQDFPPMNDFKQTTDGFLLYFDDLDTAMLAQMFYEELGLVSAISQPDSTSSTQEDPRKWSFRFALEKASENIQKDITRANESAVGAQLVVSQSEKQMKCYIQLKPPLRSPTIHFSLNVEDKLVTLETTLEETSTEISNFLSSVRSSQFRDLQVLVHSILTSFYHTFYQPQKNLLNGELLSETDSIVQDERVPQKTRNTQINCEKKSTSVSKDPSNNNIESLIFILEYLCVSGISSSSLYLEMRRICKAVNDHIFTGKMQMLDLPFRACIKEKVIREYKGAMNKLYRWNIVMGDRKELKTFIQPRIIRTRNFFNHNKVQFHPLLTWQQIQDEKYKIKCCGEYSILCGNDVEVSVCPTQGRLIFDRNGQFKCFQSQAQWFNEWPKNNITISGSNDSCVLLIKESGNTLRNFDISYHQGEILGIEDARIFESSVITILARYSDGVRLLDFLPTCES